MKHRTTVAITLIAVSALAGLAGCGGSSGSSTSAAASGTATRGGDLVIARTADSEKMNNTTVFDNESIWVFEQIFQTLYTVTPDGKGVQPMLATGYTVSADKETYTFTLRSGVKFSDGKPMTSADVKFSLDQARAAAKGWGYIDTAIKSVAAPTPSTVVVTLKYPWAPLLADLSLFSNGIVPANYGGQTETEFYNAPVGTGPFKWDYWHKGSALKLVRNTNYWQPGKPYLDSVTWTDVPSNNTRELQLKGGQAQIDEFPAWSTVASLKSTPNITMTLFNSTRTDYLGLNELRKPFGDVHVRRAISLADRPGRAGQGSAVRQRQAGQLAVPAPGALLPAGHPGTAVRPDCGQAGDGQVQRAARLLHHDPGVLWLLRRCDHRARSCSPSSSRSAST